MPPVIYDDYHVVLYRTLMRLEEVHTYDVTPRRFVSPTSVHHCISSAVIGVSIISLHLSIILRCHAFTIWSTPSSSHCTVRIFASYAHECVLYDSCGSLQILVLVLNFHDHSSVSPLPSLYYVE